MKLSSLFLGLAAVLPVVAQPLSIRPAVQLEYPTVPGKAYQLLQSGEVTNWAPFELVRLGDGLPATVLVSADEATKFFRLAVNDLRDLNAWLEPIRAANNVPALGANNNPMEPGTNADNPPAIGPAGTVHCSLLDLAKYAAFHLAGHNADTPLLPRDVMLKLHTAVPDNGSYAYGWNESTRPWANGLTLSHAGSNVQWYSVIWIAPNRDFAVVALSNIAAASNPNPGALATDQAAGKMIQEFLP